MPRLHLVRSAALTHYDEVARSVGLDPVRMLAGVGIPRECLFNPDLKVSVDAVYRLLEASAAKSGVDDFGLRLAQPGAGFLPTMITVREFGENVATCSNPCSPSCASASAVVHE